MTLEQVAVIIASAGSLLCTLIVGALTFFLKRTLSGLEDSDKKNEDAIREEAKKREAADHELERQLNDFAKDMPLVYVLREDFIRAMNGVDHGMESLGKKMDRLTDLFTKNGNGG